MLLKEIHEVFNLYDVHVRLKKTWTNCIEIKYESGNYNEFIRILSDNFGVGVAKDKKAYIDLPEQEHGISKETKYLKNKYPEKYWPRLFVRKSY